MAKGEFVALMDNDDMIPCNALYEMVKVLNKNKYEKYKILYAPFLRFYLCLRTLLPAFSKKRKSKPSGLLFYAKSGIVVSRKCGCFERSA